MFVSSVRFDAAREKTRNRALQETGSLYPSAANRKGAGGNLSVNLLWAERGEPDLGYCRMPNTLTLSALGALSIAGAALGWQLGHASVAEINPAYFKERETTFHAALAANAPQSWDQVQRQEYSQVEVPITSCIGCAHGPLPDYPVTYVPGRDPYIETAAVTRWPAQARQGRVAPEAQEQAAAAEPEQEAKPDPARERIVRFGSYPVTQEEAQAAAANGAAAAAGAPTEDVVLTR
jgi:hypothetical protein